jgi:nitroreductase
MRHFAGGQVAPEVLRRLLDAAHHAPSVGFMQPWRFIRIRGEALRQQLHAWSSTNACSRPARWASAKTSSCA